MQDIDGKLQKLLEAEYRRRLVQYNLTDRLLYNKYKMTFEEFEQVQMVKKLNYSWDVESDAMEWDLATNGISSMKRLLAELVRD